MANTTPTDDTVFRAISVIDAVESAPADRSLRFVLSTPTPDRERDSINQRGWKLDNYKKNPVVLWGHDYHFPPIAKCTDIRVEGDRLIATAEFVTADVLPFAETVFQLIKRGFLRGVSVGFRALKRQMNDERMGFDFIEQELMEFSVTPIPANPEALLLARSAGVDVEPLRAWAKGIMDALPAPDPGVGITPESIASVKESALRASASIPDEIKVCLELDGKRIASDLTYVVEKRGRVLSGRNESALREAFAALDNATARLRDVLAQVGDPEPDDDDEEDGDKPKPCAADADAATHKDTQPEFDFVLLDESVPEFRFVLIDEPEPTLTLRDASSEMVSLGVDPDVVSGALIDVVTRALDAAIVARVDVALSALRGRLD